MIPDPPALGSELAGGVGDVASGWAVASGWSLTFVTRQRNFTRTGSPFASRHGSSKAPTSPPAQAALVEGGLEPGTVVIVGSELSTGLSVPRGQDRGQACGRSEVFGLAEEHCWTSRADSRPSGHERRHARGRHQLPGKRLSSRAWARLPTGAP